MIDTFEDDFWIVHKETGPKSKKLIEICFFFYVFISIFHFIYF